VFSVKKWTFPQRMVHYVQYQYFLFYILLISRVVRMHPTHRLPTGLHHGESRELPGERDNARNDARCTQARKATHGLDGQHQDVGRTPRGRISQNDRGQINGESRLRPWCGQPWDRGRLKNRTEPR